MTISMVMCASISIFMVVMTSNSNPLKLAVLILALSMTIFLQMFMSSGEVWMPFLLSLIFIGGILMMFMILSSVLPNEKSTKNTLLIFLPLMVSAGWGTASNPVTSGLSKSMSENMSSSYFFPFMTIVMITYFLVTMMVLCENQTPLRSHQCF